MTCLVLGVLLSGWPALVGAEGPAGGSLVGTVLDPTGAALPGVSVEAHPEGGGRAASVTTAAEGAYRIDGLAPGRWEVSFRLPNFASSVSHDIVIRPGAETRLDTTLALRLTAQVLVTARATFRDLSAATNDAELIGIASSASSGVVAASEIEDRPVARPGDLAERVPGVIVSQHSGDGKANQYYLRGFNLDHGTDLATYVAGMPVNLPTHAHGQGYADLNFVIPELVSGIQFKKGTVLRATRGTSPPPARSTSNYFDKLPDRPDRRRSTLGRYGYPRALLAASPRGRQTAICSPRSSLARTTGRGSARRTSTSSTASCATARAMRERIQRDRDGLRREVELDRPGPAERAVDERLDLALRHHRPERRWPIAPLQPARSRHRQQADARSVTRVEAFVHRIRPGPLLELHLLPRRPAERRPVRAARSTAGLRPAPEPALGAGRQGHAENVTRAGCRSATTTSRRGPLPHQDPRRRLHDPGGRGAPGERSLYVQTTLRSGRAGSARRRDCGVDLYQLRRRHERSPELGRQTASSPSPKLTLAFGPWAQDRVLRGLRAAASTATTPAARRSPLTRRAASRPSASTHSSARRGAEMGVRTLVIPGLHATASLLGLDSTPSCSSPAMPARPRPAGRAVGGASS